MPGLLRNLAIPLTARSSVWLRAARARRTWDPEIRLLPQLAGGDEAAVDAGANRGVYTLPLTRLAREVYAIEPNPLLADRLRAAFGRRVHALACGLSDHEGAATLWVPVCEGRELIGRSSVEPHANPEFARRPVEVPLRTLDSLQLRDCGFVKLHIEGHELAALQGGRQTLERFRPTILTGAQVRFAADLPERIFAFLSDLGYAGYFLDHGRLRPYHVYDPAVHQHPDNVPRPGDRRGLTAGFIYNFIYLHPSRPDVRRRLEPLMTDEPAPAPLEAPRQREPALAD